MKDQSEKTLAQYQRFIESGVLKYLECSCGHQSILPMPFCSGCNRQIAQSAKWTTLDRPGTVISYTVTYVTSPELAPISPYINVLVDFGNDLRFNGILEYDFPAEKPPTDLIGKAVLVEIKKIADMERNTIIMKLF
jgi:uncharacterized OB-fold protein